MKDHIVELIIESLKKLQAEQALSFPIPEVIQVETTRDRKHGDFATNIAMVLSKVVSMQPRKLAELICQFLPDSTHVQKVDIAGPGFINFFLNQTTQYSVIENILDQQQTYGHSDRFSGQSALIEFVSANPTGPLHVGHGRGAAYGAALANLLRAIGYQVDCEYYVNDAGRQMDILAISVYLRYLELNQQSINFPDNAYQGDYIISIADELFKQHGSSLVHEIEIKTFDDPEKTLDGIIQSCKTQLGDDYQSIHTAGLNAILENIQNDLQEFGVEFERWFSEQSLNANNSIADTLSQLEENQYIYEKNGAKWFRSESLGDEKDRVVVRDNGEGTYFASDIAYHNDKFNRGYDKIIDIWGADHHGYIARVRAALKALKLDDNKLDILLVQFVSLFRGKEKVQMSTRSGQFVTLKELREEVGKDATRFFYVMRKSEQHLDFDLELAKSRNKENPVYYIQYAHARICRLMEKLQQSDIEYQQQAALENLAVLTEDKESELIKTLSSFPEVVSKSAVHYEPHTLVYYLKSLAHEFHTYYDSHRILGMNSEIVQARVTLCLSVKQVIQNGLSLLGVSAPESM